MHEELNLIHSNMTESDLKLLMTAMWFWSALQHCNILKGLSESSLFTLG